MNNSGHDQIKPVKSLDGLTIASDEVLASVTSTDARANLEAIKPLEPLQQVGIWLAIAVGVVIIAVSIPILICWLTGAPTMPDLHNLTTEQATIVIGNYKSLSSIWNENAKSMFEEIVVKALLPIFTLVLGYLFGARQNN
jgi:hypothetical protein